MSKVRLNFVSNSSSSSFICCLTGNMESGMDMGLSEAGMIRCANGHEFIESLQLEGKEPTNEDKRNWLKTRSEKYDWYKASYSESLEISEEEFEEWFDEEWKWDYEDEGIAISSCPVCQFVDLPDNDVSRYFLAQLGKTRKEFAGMMKEQFGTYDKFQEFIKQGVKK
jgi:hypothetical protein